MNIYCFSCEALLFSRNSKFTTFESPEFECPNCNEATYLPPNTLEWKAKWGIDKVFLLSQFLLINPLLCGVPLGIISLAIYWKYFEANNGEIVDYTQVFLFILGSITFCLLFNGIRILSRITKSNNRMKDESYFNKVMRDRDKVYELYN